MLKNVFKMAEKVMPLTNCTTIYQILDFMAPLPAVYFKDRNGEVQHENLSWNTFPNWNEFCKCDNPDKHSKTCYKVAMGNFATNSLTVTENEAISPFDGEIKLWGQIHAYEEIYDRILYEKDVETTFYISDIFNDVWNDLMNSPPSIKEVAQSIVGDAFEIADGETLSHTIERLKETPPPTITEITLTSCAGCTSKSCGKCTLDRMTPEASDADEEMEDQPKKQILLADVDIGYPIEENSDSCSKTEYSLSEEKLSQYTPVDETVEQRNARLKEMALAVFKESGLEHMINPSFFALPLSDPKEPKEKEPNPPKEDERASLTASSDEEDDILEEEKDEDSDTIEMESEASDATESLIDLDQTLYTAPSKNVFVGKYWKAKCHFSDWVYVDVAEEFVAMPKEDAQDIEFKNYHLRLCSDDEDTLLHMCKEIDPDTYEKGSYDIPTDMLEQIVSNSTNKYVFCDSKHVLGTMNKKDASFVYDSFLGITTKSIPLLKSIVAHTIEYIQGVNEFENLKTQLKARKQLWSIISLDGPVEYTDWSWRISGPEKKVMRFVAQLNQEEFGDFKQKVKPVKNEKIQLSMKEYEKQMSGKSKVSNLNHLAYIFMMMELLGKPFYKYAEKIANHEKTFFLWPSGKVLKNEGNYHFFDYKGKKFCYEASLHDDMKSKFIVMSKHKF